MWTIPQVASAPQEDMSEKRLLIPPHHHHQHTHTGDGLQETEQEGKLEVKDKDGQTTKNHQTIKENNHGNREIKVNKEEI